MKRMYLLIVAAVIFTLIFSGCGQKQEATEAASTGGGGVDASGHVTLEFWYSLSGDSGEAVVALVNQFNASQSKITVTATYQGDYTAIMAKVYSAITGGSLPNVAQLGGAPLLGSSDALVPVSDFITGDTSIDTSQIRQVFIDYNTTGGVFWSMPFNNSVPVMYYNKDLFTAAGLDPENPPQTFDDLIAAAQKLTLDPNNTGTPTQYGVNTRDDTHWYLSTMFLSNGVQLVKDDLSAVTYNSPDAVEILQLWGDMVNTDKVMPPNQHSEAQTDFLAGKLAIYFGSSASINTIESSAPFKLGTAVFPQIGDKQRAIPIGGGSLAIFKNDNETLRNAAWEFVKYMTSVDSSKYLSTKTGYLPIYKDAFDWPEIQDLISTEPARKAAIDTLNYAVNIPVFSALGNSDLALRQAIEKVELGAATPQEALDAAVASVNKSIEEQFSNP